MQTRILYDAAIIGGGPGGLYLASLLARRGLRIVLLEEHPEVGSPAHCTGVLAPEVLEEFAAPPAVVLNELKTVRFCSPSALEFCYSPNRIEAVVIDRRRLDQHFEFKAREHGAEVHTGARVKDVRMGTDRVTLRVGSRRIEARCCVLACGANYSFNRQLGLGVPSLFLQSAQLEIPVRGPRDVELHFGAKVAPKGFAWVVPVHRPQGWHARVGLMCERSALSFFGRFIRSIAEKWGVEPHHLNTPPRPKVLPLAPIERTYSDRLIAVGDSAGLTKPTTGGGIYYSLASAAIAAETLDKALRADQLEASFLSKYESAWRSRFGREFEAQRDLRLTAQSLKDEEIDELFELARTDGILPLVRRTLRFNRQQDFIRRFLSTPAVRRILFNRFVAG